MSALRNMKLFRFCLSLCGISDISGSLLAVSYYSTEVWFSGNCVLSFLCSGLLVIASHTNHTVLFFSLQWNSLLLPVKKNPSFPSLPKFFFFTAKNREWERPTGHQVLKIENVHATAWIIRWNIKIIVLLVFYTSCFLFVTCLVMDGKRLHNQITKKYSILCNITITTILQLLKQITFRKDCYIIRIT